MEADWELRVYLHNTTPILGCEIKPWTHVNIKGSLSPPTNFNVHLNWYRWTDRNSWIYIGRSTTYTPSVHDIGSILKLEAFAVDNYGIPKSAVTVLVTSSTLAPPQHYHRCMIDYSTSKEVTKVENFRVLSYNILADICVNSQKYYHCPSWALTWEYRRQNLMNEIVRYDADVICIQEMQSDHLEDFFKPELEKHGYGVVYKSKSQQVHIQGNYTSDGCAIFYRRRRFSLVKHYEVEFSKFAVPIIEELEPSRKSDAVFRLMKGNVANAVVLEERSLIDGSVKLRICVANTHLHSDPKNKEVKYLQTTKFLQGLEKLASSSSLQIPTIICGDMNCLPISRPYRFFTTGSIKAPKKTDLPNLYKHLRLNHSMNLASAYTSLQKSGPQTQKQGKKGKNADHRKEPRFTSITPRFKRTLDYIFYTENMLQVDGLLELLDNQSLGKMPLPSPLWSSDHIALMANFRVSGNLQHLQNVILPLDIWEE